MKKIDREVAEVLQKNIDIAERNLSTAPAAKVDEYLSKLLNAKEDYARYVTED